MKNQTPKQKANYLVALFESIAHPTIDFDKQFAKECARRCIDEIIDTDPFFEKRHEQNDCVWYQPESNVIYWEQVKQEIDNL
jgi:hypothetical protein